MTNLNMAQQKKASGRQSEVYDLTQDKSNTTAQSKTKSKSINPLANPTTKPTTKSTTKPSVSKAILKKRRRSDGSLDYVPDGKPKKGQQPIQEVAVSDDEDESNEEHDEKIGKEAIPNDRRAVRVKLNTPSRRQNAESAAHEEPSIKRQRTATDIVDEETLNGDLERFNHLLEMIRGRFEAKARAAALPRANETNNQAATPASGPAQLQLPADEELPAKFERMRRKCETLENRVAGYDRERAAILGQTKRDIAKMTEQLLKYKSIYEYEKISDDVITSQWTNMSFKIAQVVRICLTKQPGGKITLPLCSDKEGVIQAAKDRKEKPQLKHFILQKYIIRRLIYDIFRGGKGLWAGEAEKDFVNYCQTLRRQGKREQQRIPYFADIKARTAQNLAVAFKCSNKSLDDYADSLCQDLRIFLKESEDVDCEIKMRSIVHQAFDLHLILMKSKAFFSFEIPFKGFPKEEDIDEAHGVKIVFRRDFAQSNIIDERIAHRRVDLVVSPAIEKLGDADATVFGYFYVCPADVTTSG